MLSTRSPTFKHDTVKFPDCPLLGDVSIVSLIGQDAEAFAQSQFMNDVQALPVGHWHWNGWLSAKGRVLALFALARVAPGELLLALLDAPPDEFRAGLQRFVFRSRVRIERRDDLGAHGEWLSAPTGALARDALLPGPAGAIGLDCSGAGASRRMWIAPRGTGGPDEASSLRWRLDDLRHGLPRWATGREHGWTPHMLSLDELRAFSTKKGCYPGQEIVARTHFLGQSKRRAWWLDGQGLAAGLAVNDAEGRPVGEVLEAAADGRGALAVAALPAPGTVLVGAGPALASPPLTGLARPA